MKKIIKLFIFVIIPVLTLSACDLQPKILSFPDSVGEFISTRYPALLADPETQSDIYNSAATDYGVYASPELYGSGTGDDYLLYANADDYVLQPADVKVTDVPSGESGVTLVSADDTPINDYLRVPFYGTVPQETEIIVAKGDTLYSIARKHNMSTDQLVSLNGLSKPYVLSVGQKLKISQTVTAEPVSVAPVIKNVPIIPTVSTKVAVKEITVSTGDTLYSLSRQYSIPVNDLAVMNKLSAPFTLAVGQMLKVPNLVSVPAISAQPVRTAVTPVKTAAGVKIPVSGTTVISPSVTPPVKVPITAAKTVAPQSPQTVRQPKISSDPNKKLPAITSRSSSKFAWPTRGTILSSFGAKSNGLFNDGVNIGAAVGTTVSAAENGVVAYAGNEVKGMGNLVIIQHSDGWMTVYAHMDDMSVRRGSKVNIGQKIGTVGKTGKVDKPQLHFEIRKGSKAYNPSAYLKK